MSQCGHFASIYAHLVLICGHVASVCGHFASVYGSFAPLSRCCASPCGHFMSLCRHFVSPCGHFVPVTHTSFQCDISGLIHVFVFSFHLSFKKKGCCSDVHLEMIVFSLLVKQLPSLKISTVETIWRNWGHCSTKAHACRAKPISPITIV